MRYLADVFGTVVVDVKNRQLASQAQHVELQFGHDWIHGIAKSLPTQNHHLERGIKAAKYLNDSLFAHYCGIPVFWSACPASMQLCSALSASSKVRPRSTLSVNKCVCAPVSLSV